MTNGQLKSIVGIPRVYFIEGVECYLFLIQSELKIGSLMLLCQFLSNSNWYFNIMLLLPYHKVFKLNIAGARLSSSYPQLTAAALKPETQFIEK